MAYRLFKLTHQVFYENRIVLPYTQSQGWLQFVNCQGRARREGTSLYNPAQISIVTRIVTDLLQWLEPSQIGVLCFYASQRIKVNEYFDRFQLLWQIKVGTVDSFQGQQFKAVILLTTSTDFISKFMNDRNRVNVATSRAKEQLYIVGKQQTLRTSELWKEILDKIDDINSSSTYIINHPIQRPTLDDIRPRRMINGQLRRP